MQRPTRRHFPSTIALPPAPSHTLDAVAPARLPMSIKLRFIGGPTDGHDVLVARLPITIGRNSESDICLNDRWVSRRHCELRLDGDQLAVRDLGSTHGTMVNDRLIDRAVLHSGDRLAVGATVIVVQATEESAAAHAGVEEGSTIGRLAVS